MASTGTSAQTVNGRELSGTEAEDGQEDGQQEGAAPSPGAGPGTNPSTGSPAAPTTAPTTAATQGQDPRGSGSIATPSTSIPTDSSTTPTEPSASPESPSSTTSPKPGARATVAAAALNCPANTVLAHYPNGVLARLTLGGSATIPVASVYVPTTTNVPSGWKISTSGASAFDVSRDGQYAFQTVQVESIANPKSVKYMLMVVDFSGATAAQYLVDTVASASYPVRGGFNPVDGKFYYSADSVLYTASYNPTTHAVTQATVGSFGGLVATGGDLAFDDQGNMFIVAGSPTTQSALYRVSRSVLESVSGGNATIPTTKLRDLLGIRLPTLANGVTFGSDGYLYVSNGGTTRSSIWKIDPGTGAAIGDPVELQDTAAGIPAAAVGDLGNCVGPSTLSVTKSLTGQRAASTDQFTLSVIDEKGAAVGTAVTTTGSGQTVTTNYGPVTIVPGQKFTISETAPSGSSTVMARYTSSYRCVDAGGAVVLNGSGTTFTLAYPSGAGQAITCTFTNIPVPSALALVKKWKVVDGANAVLENVDGTNADLASTVSAIKVNGTAISSPPAWGATLNSVFQKDTITLTETVTLGGKYAGCRWVPTSTTAVTTGTGQSTQITQGNGSVDIGTALAAGAQSLTVTNTIQCSRLILSKVVDNTAAGSQTAGLQAPTAWNQGLFAQAGSNPKLTFNLGETKYAAAGTYILSESDQPGYALSKLTCNGADVPLGTRTVTLATSGANATVSCVLTNAAQYGTVTWSKKDDGDHALAGSSWSLTGPGAGTSQTVTDCVASTAASCTGPDKDPAAGAFKVTGLTWGAYTVQETKAPPGYVLTTKTGSATIGATNLSPSLGEFSNQQAPAVVLPLTGGTGADLFRYGGPLLLALALGAAWLHRLRTRKRGRP